MNIDFATANRILVGSGKVREVRKIAVEFGRRVLLVRGKHATGIDLLRADLEKDGYEVIEYLVSGEPDIRVVESGVQQVRDVGGEIVIAAGGGSVLDAGKAIAGLALNDGPILDYLEVVGKGLPLTKPVLPLIAIPTTAGTGSEVTRNAVITVPERRVKVSLRSPKLLPKLAVVDPQLTLTLPPAVTASSGMDALTQVLEPFVSKKANPLTDLFCQEGLQQAGRYLLMACEHGDNLAAREAMSWVSILGGLSLANAGLGAVHGFAGPLGGLFEAPHGAICAALLPSVVQVNYEILAKNQPGHPAAARYAKIAQLLTNDPGASIADGVRWLEDLVNRLHIAPLRSYGISTRDFPLIVEKAAASSSMKGNLVELSAQDLVRILEMAL